MTSYQRHESRSFDPPQWPSPPDPGVAEALTQWINTDVRARLLVDDNLQLRWMSPAAAELMNGPNSILVRNGHIHTRENRFDDQLRGLVSNASCELSSCCIYDSRTGEHLVLLAVRLPAAHDLVGLTIHRVDEDFSFSLADLRAAFGLTPTESRVAYHLICGLTAEETAQELGISLETVRTHIKRAYAKLDVSSREAFFHRLTPFVILLG